LLGWSDGSIRSRLERGRAIMALEKIGTAQARAVLDSQAKGAPTARVTFEAQAALTRLH
jgi:hypothetical protein